MGGDVRVLDAQAVLADAVKKIPQSVKIWLHAASLETNVTMRRRVLPADRPSIAASVHNIGSVPEAQGKHEEALAKYEEALAMLRRVLPAGPLREPLSRTLARSDAFRGAGRAHARARCGTSRRTRAGLARRSAPAARRAPLRIRARSRPRRP